MIYELVQSLKFCTSCTLFHVLKRIAEKWVKIIRLGIPKNISKKINAEFFLEKNLGERLQKTYSGLFWSLIQKRVNIFYPKFFYLKRKFFVFLLLCDIISSNRISWTLKAYRKGSLIYDFDRVMTSTFCSLTYDYIRVATSTFCSLTWLYSSHKLNILHFHLWLYQSCDLNILFSHVMTLCESQPQHFVLSHDSESQPHHFVLSHMTLSKSQAQHFVLMHNFI